MKDPRRQLNYSVKFEVSAVSNEQLKMVDPLIASVWETILSCCIPPDNLMSRIDRTLTAALSLFIGTSFPGTMIKSTAKLGCYRYIPSKNILFGINTFQSYLSSKGRSTSTGLENLNA